MTGTDGRSIEIAGRDVPIGSFERVTRTIGFECTSGRWIEHEWTGIPIDRLLAAAAGPAEATHIVVEAADGHTACIDLPSALEGLLAVERDGQRLDGPRFVSPRITGPRAVSEVARIDPVALAADERPTDRESMDLVPD